MSGKHFLIELSDNRSVVVSGERLVAGLNGWLDVVDDAGHVVAHFLNAVNAFPTDDSKDLLVVSTSRGAS